MAPIIRGSELSARYKKTSAIEQASGSSGWQNFHLYTENFQPGEGLVANDILGGERHNLVDPTDMVPALPNPTGAMKVPLCINQYGIWLTSMLGPPTTEDEDDPVFEHVWTSGLTAPQLGHHDMPLGAIPRMCDSQAVSAMSLDLAPVDGVRPADLTFMGRSVRRLVSALAVSPTAAHPLDQVPGSKGLIKINGTNFGNVLGGNFTVSNAAFFERYLNDSEWPAAVEIGQPNITCSPQIRIRSDAAAMLDLFDGVTPFTFELLYQLSADRLIKFFCPNVKAPKVIPSAAGIGGVDVSPGFMFAQTTSAPMITVTARNGIEAY